MLRELTGVALLLLQLFLIYFFGLLMTITWVICLNTECREDSTVLLHTKEIISVLILFCAFYMSMMYLSPLGRIQLRNIFGNMEKNFVVVSVITASYLGTMALTGTAFLVGNVISAYTKGR